MIKRSNGYYAYKLLGWKCYKTTGTRDWAKANRVLNAAVDGAAGESFNAPRLRYRTALEMTVRELLSLALPRSDDSFEWRSQQSWIRSTWQAISGRERIAILYVLHQGKCHYCKKLVHLDRRHENMKSEAQIDHMNALSNGGYDSFENSTLACRRCNNLKRTQDYDSFEQKMKNEATESERERLGNLTDQEILSG